jgi:hypothetical protein
MIIDTTLCGDWAGTPAIYNASSCYSTVAPNQGICYNDNVLGDGSNYANAYFEIASVRAYTLDGVQVVHNGTSSSSSASASGTKVSTGTSSGASASATGGSGNGAASLFTGGPLVSWAWALGAVFVGAIFSL